MQKAFLDHYLKGLDTWNQAPVHLRLRNIDGSFTDRDEQEWPLKRTRWTKFYLHGDGSLSETADDNFALSFEADGEGLNFFTEPLEEELEITGPIAGHMTISSSTEDADVFLTMRVLDTDTRCLDYKSCDELSKLSVCQIFTLSLRTAPPAARSFYTLKPEGGFNAKQNARIPEPCPTNGKRIDPVLGKLDGLSDYCIPAVQVQSRRPTHDLRPASRCHRLRQLRHLE